MSSKTNKEFKLASWAIDNKNTIYVMMGLFFVVGLSAYFNMPRESFPEVKETKIYISTPFPGNTAEDIERLIVDPLEDRLKNCKQCGGGYLYLTRRLRIIIVEFDENISVDAAKQKIKDEVDR